MPVIVIRFGDPTHPMPSVYAEALTTARQSLRVSTVGTQLLDAMTAEIGQRISCGTCKTFLQSLNYTTEHDHDKILLRLYADLPLSKEWRAKNPDVKARLSTVLEGIVPR